jgi:hypothetical protein
VAQEPARNAGVQDRAIPFWPDSVPAAIRAETDGAAALETVRELARFHRVQGSPGYAAAAELVRSKAAAAGLADATIERLPADGKTRYAHFLSYLGWDPRSGVLEEVSPGPRTLQTIASFETVPVALADYSQDAEVTAELVDVGKGTSAADYADKDVRGRIVLADGDLPTVHRLACEERGAAGFLSDYPNQATPWSGEDEDQIRWGHLSPYQTANRFAFMVSRRQAKELRARLSGGEKIRLRARVKAKMVPATYDVVVATIPGTDPVAGEVVLTAHLCHESAGANDNASGSAAILEVARALSAAIRRGALSTPARTIRFLWLPEIAGSQAYLARHPEVVARLVAGVHMDMVGGLLSTTHGTFHLSRTAESLPHVVNAIAQAWFDHVVRASARYAEGRGDAAAGLVFPPGSREAFLGDVRPLELGSDHEVFEAAGFGVPMVYFHDYPDVTIHTQKDVPENLDATKLGRVAYMGAGIAYTLAALPESEQDRMYDLAFADATVRVARAPTAGDPGLATREGVATSIAELESVARLWPSTADAVAEETAQLRAELAPSARPADARVPVRNPEIRGPLQVYYYDYLRRAGVDAGADALAGRPSVDPAKTALAAREDGGLLAYEALNLADGKRSISEIRDALAGRYAPVPLSAVAEYFEMLARAGAVRLP